MSMRANHSTPMPQGKDLEGSTTWPLNAQARYAESCLQALQSRLCLSSWHIELVLAGRDEQWPTSQGEEGAVHYDWTTEKAKIFLFYPSHYESNDDDDKSSVTLFKETMAHELLHILIDPSVESTTHRAHYEKAINTLAQALVANDEIPNGED